MEYENTAHGVELSSAVLWLLAFSGESSQKFSGALHWDKTKLSILIYMSSNLMMKMMMMTTMMIMMYCCNGEKFHLEEYV